MCIRDSQILFTKVQAVQKIAFLTANIAYWKVRITRNTVTVILLSITPGTYGKGLALTFITKIPLTHSIFKTATYTQHLLQVLDSNNDLSLSRDKLKIPA